MPAQPTILVKKKDGTSVRMTMDEFKDYVRTTKGARNYESTNNETQATELQKPIAESQTVKPVVKPVVKSAMKQWTKEDHKSPLEAGEVKEARKQEVVKTMLPESRWDAYDAVIRNLKFPVRDELRPRLKSLIVSRVKDIRTDEQVIEYATRAVANGGLGLSEAQAGELAGAIKSTNTAITNNINTVKIQKTRDKQIINSKFQIPNNNLNSKIQNSRFPEHRPVMHDVIAPSAPREEVKVSVGPIEELQQLTLTDFRRLASNPAQAGEILLEKFEGLKNESYLLFLKAVQAWYNSPLYKQYQQTVADAINQDVKIGQTLGQMKNEEWAALVKLCNSL